ncbi:MAG: radical SAM protein [Candidatus Omnitrophica bacterium]|nr:radical SAM protein [Candidatus Omnitrophota bacterium]
MAALTLFKRLIETWGKPSYVVFFVTSRCNAACPMCLYQSNMQQNSGQPELTVEEYDKISRSLGRFPVLGISGGEPFLRKDLADIVSVIYRNSSPLVLDLPTNGFLTEAVLAQAEAIARQCPDMSIDLQLSIDGPEAVHNKIRGVSDGFNRLRATYAGLVMLKRQYRNLRVKACVVFSQYNEDHMPELFRVLDRDFPELDRVILSVVHGRVSDPVSGDVHWQKYFDMCDAQRRNVVLRDRFDAHSLFTMALRFVKNDFLKSLLRTKDMYRYCRAGKGVVVIDELGKVFGCEHLWQAVGGLRENGYDAGKILNAEPMRAFQRQIRDKKCNCHWGLPMSNALLFSPRYYPAIVMEMARILFRRPKKERGDGL